MDIDRTGAVQSLSRRRTQYWRFGRVVVIGVIAQTMMGCADGQNSHPAMGENDKQTVARRETRHVETTTPIVAQGTTPLHLAAQEGDQDEIIKLLLHGADVNARDSEGYTPLHLAARGNHVKCARTLVNHGADMTARANNGKTPLAVALESGSMGVADVIRLKGIKE